MIEVRQTLIYAEWFDQLRDRQAQAGINVRIRRLSLGNPGDVRPVGEGVSELRIDYGPGYRVYFVQRGATMVILLCGGDKSTQDRDVEPPRNWRGRNDAMSLETMPWDVTEHLDNDEAIAAYVDAALEDGDPALIAAALGDIARARGMAQIASETGLSRESLYRALSTKGNPEFGTILAVMRALGLRLSAKPLPASA